MSCWGKKPFGTFAYRKIVAAIVPSVTSSVNGWCFRTHPSDRSYPPRIRVERPLARPEEAAVGRLRLCGRRSFAHIIGVVVSEMTSETAMATESVVTANSRKSRPTMPPIRRIGMKTATSETLIEMTVKPISLRPLERRLERLHALLESAA